MQERDDYIEKLVEQIDNMITSIEDREVDESGFVSVREIAEQLRDELDALQET